MEDKRGLNGQKDKEEGTKREKKNGKGKVRQKGKEKE